MLSCLKMVLHEARGVFKMLLQKNIMASSAPVYNLNRHMSAGGGHSWRVSDSIQNNASVICPANFILFFASQAC